MTPGTTHSLSLARLPRPARIAVRLLWAFGLVGLAAFTLAAGFGLGDPRGSGFEVLYVCLHLVPAALCILRAALVRQERIVWAAFGIGILFWGGGYAYFLGVLQHLDPPPYPSGADALWITYLALSFVAVMFLIRARLRGLRAALWIDAIVGALALAAVGAALLVDPIVAGTGGSAGGVATGLAYPLADLIVISVVLGAFALSGWSLSRTWVLIGIGFTIQAAADVVYLYQAAGGVYETGTLLDAMWPAAMLLVALAAWQKTEVTQGSQLQGVAAIAITSAFALVGLLLTTLDHWRPIGDVAFGLATLTLVAAFVRTAMTFADMRSLAESKQLLLHNRSILNSAGEGIYGLDREGRTTFANPAAARLTGHRIEELIGRRSHELVHHTKPDGTPFPVEECPIFKSLEDGTVHQSADDVYWRKDGTSFPVEYTSTPIVEDGQVKGAVVVFKDISERREVDRIKDEFTSVVSHELRTPLTSIRGSLGLLESGVLGPLPEKGQRMVEIAVDNTDRLVRLINDILDIERIDSGKIQLRREPCDAAELISGATEVMQSLAAEAQVTLVSDASPAALSADSDRVLQTLTNLISNAIKFSPAASTVRVSAAPRDGQVLFQVTDQGRGIPAEKLDTIFQRFQQVDASDSREKGGTGLGLAICRSIVDYHGGRIWAQSTPGEGSTISFLLPASADDQPVLASREDGGPAVLVCDDDASVVEVVGAMLEQRGYRAIPASSGEQALKRATAQRPVAILLDLLMPGMGGWETAAALAAHPETTEIPIIILSVLSEAEGKEGGEPVAEWVEKPVDERALFDALGRAVETRREAFRVLIVEDDSDLGGVLATLLERHGIEVFGASDGREAIELSQQVLPDLLVLDIGLPEADGFEVVDWLRHHERLQSMPLVVYTGRELDDADRERLRLGTTTEFLTKGRITPEDFERHVMTLLAQLTADRGKEAADEPEAHPVGR